MTVYISLPKPQPKTKKQRKTPPTFAVFFMHLLCELSVPRSDLSQQLCSSHGVGGKKVFRPLKEPPGLRGNHVFFVQTRVLWNPHCSSLTSIYIRTHWFLGNPLFFCTYIGCGVLGIPFFHPHVSELKQTHHGCPSEILTCHGPKLNFAASQKKNLKST